LRGKRFIAAQHRIVKEALYAITVDKKKLPFLTVERGTFDFFLDSFFPGFLINFLVYLVYATSR
jgi:hypothetical protein